MQTSCPYTSSVTAWYTPGVCESRYVGGQWQTYYYATDAQGTTKQLVDSLQRTSDEYAYNAWGEEFAHLRNDAAAPKNPLRYVGKSGYYSDDDTGLDLLGVRYYDPLIGRFITPDPSRDGLNWYAYAGNNPVNMIDPTGNIAQYLVIGYAVVSTIADVAGTVVDAGAFIANPTIGGGVMPVGDAAGIANPIAPAPGGVKVVAKVAKGIERGYKAFKNSSFRRNLAILTGGIPDGSQAHHVLPQALRKQFDGLFPNININDPKFGSWVDTTHQKWSKAYQRDWEELLRKGPDWGKVRSFARKMGKKYGFETNF